MSTNNITNVLIRIDTFCDYIPLVSSVTNVIDLFQKCVVLPFVQKSTIQVNHYYKHLNEKSFVRCVLLVIPVFGNIIIGIYDFSNQRYDNKESMLVVATKKPDPFKTQPNSITFEIVSYLNLHELGISRNLSKSWKILASKPILWQSAVYREIAFSSKNWAEWDAGLVKDVDIRQEMLSLPQNIAEELRRSAFPGKSIRETHVLVRMPKGFTLKKLGELAKKYFPSNANGYRHLGQPISDELSNKPTDEFVWLMMTNDVLLGSRNKSYRQQKNIIAELAKTTKIDYQDPTILEAATCILAEYSRSRNRLFSDNPCTYTRCQESFQGYQIIVGGFDPSGLIINPYNIVNSYNSDKDLIGIAALRKFYGSSKVSGSWLLGL